MAEPDIELSDSIVKQIPIIRIKENIPIHMEDAIIDEEIFRLFINNEKAFEMVFSMTHSRELAAGFLTTQSIVKTRSDIIDLEWNPDKKQCHLTLDTDALKRFKQFKKGSLVKGSSGGSLLLNTTDNITIDPSDSFCVKPYQILSLINQHWNYSTLFHKTGAVHSAGLCDTENILEYYEDIGRHNAVDKLAGHILINQIDTRHKIATLSCRMSLEIIGKLIKTGIPIVISNAAPTLSAVKLADRAGLTIIGFARDNRFNIYTHPSRVIQSESP